MDDHERDLTLILERCDAKRIETTSNEIRVEVRPTELDDTNLVRLEDAVSLDSLVELRDGLGDLEEEEG